MKIVIDIPEKWYIYAKFNDIENGSMVSKGILDAVGNGTPLPKGHGRLIDADALYDQFEYADYDFEETLEYAPTILEADKAESEDKE